MERQTRFGDALSLPEGPRWAVGHHHGTGDVGARSRGCDHAGLGNGRPPASPWSARRPNVFHRSRCDSMPRRCDPPAGTCNSGLETCLAAANPQRTWCSGVEMITITIIIINTVIVIIIIVMWRA